VLNPVARQVEPVELVSVHVPMNKSPLAAIKERFGDDPKEAKAQLVAAVKKAGGKDLWLERLNERKGLEHVSNRKLLHLEEIFATVKKEAGSREKLVDELADLRGHGQDEQAKARLALQPTPKLWDQLQVERRRAARGARR
jgi:hypothetical protein